MSTTNQTNMTEVPFTSDNESDIIQGELFTPIGREFTPPQYDLTTAGQPERKRSRKTSPARPVYDALKNIYVGGDRNLWMVANKLVGAVGVDLALSGCRRIARNKYYKNFVWENGVSVITQAPRIVQAACHEDAQREIVDIELSLAHKQHRLAATEEELTRFLQGVHTAHPAMRKWIKSAAEVVMRAAFKCDVEWANYYVTLAVDVARQDKPRIATIQRLNRTPKETAAWLVQIIVNEHTRRTTQKGG